MDENVYARWGDRYHVVRSGIWWRIQTGTGTRLTGRFLTKSAALHMAAELLTAFYDGRFVGMNPNLIAHTHSANPQHNETGD